MNKKIIIIDDDRELVSELTNIFEEEDFQVYPYYSTRFVNALSEIKPDVILLDIWFADQKEGIIQLKSISKFKELENVPIIVMSSDKFVIEEIKKNNIDGYFVKPLDFEELVKKVKEIVKKV